MNRTLLSLGVVALLFCTGCLPRALIKDSSKAPATKEDVAVLRQDLSQSFQLLYTALVQKIEAARQAPPVAAAPKQKPKPKAKSGGQNG